VPTLTPPEPPLSDGEVVLRPYTLADVADVTAACQDREISRWTATIPWPYREEHAREWIEGHALRWESGEAAEFAVTTADDGALLGSNSLLFNWPSNTAVAGYWVAAWARNRGVATRALRLSTTWALETLGLDSVELVTMVGNVASERVAEKAGFEMVGEIADYEHPMGPEHRYHVRRWLLRNHNG